MTINITILGTGTCEIDLKRNCASALIEIDDTRIVFDMGRGIASRLRELGYYQDDIRHIMLSHFHPDHTEDLIPFLHEAVVKGRSVPLNIYGPKGTQDIIEYVNLIIGGNRIKNTPFRLNIIEVDSKVIIDGKEFTYPDVIHSNGHGLLFEVNEKKIFISGDTSYGNSLSGLMNNTALVILDIGHMTVEDITHLIQESKPKRVVGTHIYSHTDIDTLSKIPCLEIGVDKQTISIG